MAARLHRYSDCGISRVFFPKEGSAHVVNGLECIIETCTIHGKPLSSAEPLKGFM